MDNHPSNQEQNSGILEHLFDNIQHQRQTTTEDLDTLKRTYSHFKELSQKSEHIPKLLQKLI